MTDQIEPEVESADPEVTLDPRAEGEAVAIGERDSAQEQDEVQTLKQELAAAQQEAAANHDKFLRARADMENYKKRVERTYADLAKSSKKELLNRLLTVQDNLERALHYGEAASSGESIIEGVRLTQ